MGVDKNQVNSDIGESGLLPNIAKCYLLITNLIVLMFGVLITGLGTFAVIYYSTETYYTTHFFICILGGFILILISNIALRGISKENTTLLKIYLGLLIIPTIIKLVAFILHRYYGFSMLFYFKYEFDSYGVNAAATENVDLIHKVLDCCGFDGPESIEFKNGSYPLSCCREPAEICETPTYTSKCSVELQNTFSMIVREFRNLFVLYFCVKVLCVIATSYLILFLKRHKAKNQDVIQYSKF